MNHQLLDINWPVTREDITRELGTVAAANRLSILIDWSIESFPMLPWVDEVLAPALPEGVPIAAFGQHGSSSFGALNKEGHIVPDIKQPFWKNEIKGYEWIKAQARNYVIIIGFGSAYWGYYKESSREFVNELLRHGCPVAWLMPGPGWRVIANDSSTVSWADQQLPLFTFDDFTAVIPRIEDWWINKIQERKS